MVKAMKGINDIGSSIYVAVGHLQHLLGECQYSSNACAKAPLKDVLWWCKSTDTTIYEDIYGPSHPSLKPGSRL